MVNKVETGSLILRLVLGVSFLLHGVDKFQMGLGNVAGWFDSIGIPGFMAYLVAWFELLGGIALIVGLATRIVSALTGLLMIVAIFTVKLSGGFIGSDGMVGYELDVAFLGIALFLLINGSKLFAVDTLFFSSKGTKK